LSKRHTRIRAKRRCESGKAIEDDPGLPAYILTEPWVGYRFHDPFEADSPGAELAVASVDDDDNP
jgi:hypothetical protein